MEIADWLIKNKMSLKQLAEIAKVPSSTLYTAFSHKRVLNGWYSISINRATKGEVLAGEAANPDRKPFRDERKQLKKKQLTCPHCKEEFKAPRGWVKQ